MEDKEYMPVHPCDIKQPNCPEKVPISLLNESRAISNHGQSLQRLRERGGLSVKEMLCIIHDKRWSYYENLKMPFAIAALNKILDEQTK